MATISVLVVGPYPALSSSLAGRVSQGVPPVDLAHVRPDAELVERVRARSPDVAVIDRIDERPVAAQLEIALLKERSPHVRIIAVSARSTKEDAAVVEQSIFYYLAGGTETQLARVVEAAVADVPPNPRLPRKSG